MAIVLDANLLIVLVKRWRQHEEGDGFLERELATK